MLRYFEPGDGDPISSRLCEDCAKIVKLKECKNCFALYRAEVIHPFTYLGTQRTIQVCDYCDNELSATFPPQNQSTGRRGYTFRHVTSRKFGIELETSHCPDHKGMYNECCFGAKYDGSVDGMEFYSPILQGDQGLREIARFCDYAAAKEFKVDNKCGYHAHFDIRGYKPQTLHKIVTAYTVAEPIWTKFVTKRRLSNTYSHTLEWSLNDIPEPDRLPRWARETDRYNWVNLLAISSHGSIEVRLHQGTLNKDKVINWVVAHNQFQHWASKHSLDRIVDTFQGKSPAQMFKSLSEIWDKPILTAFYKDRAQSLNPELTPHLTAALA